MCPFPNPWNLGKGPYLVRRVFVMKVMRSFWIIGLGPNPNGKCHIWVCLCFCTWVWRPEVDNGCLPQSLSTLVFETRTLAESRVHWLVQTGWTVSQSPLDVPLVQGLQTFATISGFFLEYWVSKLKFQLLHIQRLRSNQRRDIYRVACVCRHAPGLCATRCMLPCLDFTWVWGIQTWALRFAQWVLYKSLSYPFSLRGQFWIYFSGHIVVRETG